MSDRLRRYIKSVGAAWGLLLGFVLVALGVAYFYSPTRLTVAVVKGAEERILRELGVSLNQGRVIRLKIEEFHDFRATAAALEAKRADLAVIQPDVLFPTSAGTIAILREEMLIVLVPATAKIEDAAGLANKRIAMIVRRQSDSDLMNRTFAHYDLAERIREIPADEFFTALRSDGIEALAFLAAPGTPFAQQMMEAATRVLGTELAVVSLQGSSAFSRTSPGLDAGTLGAGTLKGRPQIPAEDVKTLSSSYRLVASTDLDRAVVARVAEALFQQRQALARSEPDANLIKAPDNDLAMSATLPNHRGAIDYFNREQLTFMDKYGDWLWLGLFAAGGATSVFSWLAELFARRRREALDVTLARLQKILAEARECQTQPELQRLTLELDKLVSRSIAQTRKKATTPATMGALMISIESARHAIGDQRHQLTDKITPNGGWADTVKCRR